MHDYPVIVFTALMILGYGIFSKLTEKSIISAPMVFVSVGYYYQFFCGRGMEGRHQCQVGANPLHR